MIIDDDPPNKDEPNVVQLRKPGDKPTPPNPTIIVNKRRYHTDNCKHRGAYHVDTRLATVECGDCGAALSPMFVLEMLAYHEAYWNARCRDLQAYLDKINKELEARSRTKCTHCGNMTAIRFIAEMPRTWVQHPEG
jgi:hypothetical protein